MKKCIHYTILKENLYKWTHTIQIHVVQGSSVDDSRKTNLSTP